MKVTPSLRLKRKYASVFYEQAESLLQQTIELNPVKTYEYYLGQLEELSRYADESLDTQGNTVYRTPEVTIGTTDPSFPLLPHVHYEEQAKNGVTAELLCLWTLPDGHQYGSPLLAKSSSGVLEFYEPSTEFDDDDSGHPIVFDPTREEHLAIMRELDEEVIQLMLATYRSQGNKPLF